MAELTICLPTHNRVASLPGVLGAIRAQTFEDYEVLVGDDHSSDGTADYLASLKWEKLRVVRHGTNLNYFGNLSVLFTMARGRYIAIHHDGDLCFPRALETLVALLERHPEAGFAHSACITTDGEKGERIYPLPPERRLLRAGTVLPGAQLLEILSRRIHTPIAPSVTVWRRDVVELAGGYRPDWRLASDEDLYRRVATVAGSCFYPEPLFRMPARLPARETALGSWDGLYAVYEFRRDTTLRFWKASWMQRRWNLCRLSGLKAKALLKQSLSAWIRGHRHELDQAVAWERVPSFPTGRQPLPPLCKAAFQVWISILRVLQDVGTALGRCRCQLKDTAK